MTPTQDLQAQAAVNVMEARVRAAARYPEAIVDTMGRSHVPAPRRAILSGAWDHAPIVQREVG
ncbi:MAG: hypothetical protein DI625_14580 [Sphingomonas sp.]|nr:MAG: hypothetical protein DI625_14580 [Sphingomonas sp.]